MMYREVKRGELNFYLCDLLLSYFPEEPEAAKLLFSRYGLLKELRNRLAHTLTTTTAEEIAAECGTAARLTEEIEAVILACYPACDPAVFSVYDRCIDFIKSRL